MKQFILMGIFTISIFSSIVDKVYIYSSNSKEDDKKYSYQSGLLIEKSINVSNDSFFKISGFSKYKKDSNNIEVLDFKIYKAYYKRFYFNDIISMSIGRDIKDFSFTKTYNILGFLNAKNNFLDTNERYLGSSSVDGISLSLNNPRDEAKSIIFHSYINDIHTKEGRSKQRYLLEFTISRDSVRKSIFINKNSDEDIALSLAITKTFWDKFNYSAVLKYQGGISSVSGLEYNPTSNLVFGIETIRLHNKIQSRDSRKKKYEELKGDKYKIKKLYSDLSSSSYIVGFTRYKISNLSLIASNIHNLHDSSLRVSTQIEYKYKNISLFIKHTKHIGDEYSEFGEIKKLGFEDETKVLISYMKVF